MVISTTLLIFFIFLIPSLIFYFYPYESKTCFDCCDPTTKGVGLAIATLLLLANVLVTSIRLSDPQLNSQKIDLSEIISFKSNHKPNAADIYSALTNK